MYKMNSHVCWIPESLKIQSLCSADNQPTETQGEWLLSTRDKTQSHCWFLPHTELYSVLYNALVPSSAFGFFFFLQTDNPRAEVSGVGRHQNRSSLTNKTLITLLPPMRKLEMLSTSLLLMYQRGLKSCLVSVTWYFGICVQRNMQRIYKVEPVFFPALHMIIIHMLD